MADNRPEKLSITATTNDQEALELLSDQVEKKRLKRFMVVSELYDTERNYVADLNNLVRNCLDPLNSAYLSSVANSVAAKGDPSSAAKIIENTTFGNEGGGWITFNQKQAIVRNASHLLRVQKLFFKLLEESVRIRFADGDNVAAAPSTETFSANTVASDPSGLQIARAFITMLPKMETVYIQFCSMHDIALETLAAIKKANPNQLQNFLDECRARMNSRLELQDFLIKPVQRICKYPLLIKELLKATPPESKDYLELNEALDKMKSVVSSINEKKRVCETEHRKDILFSRFNNESFQKLVNFLDMSSDSKIDAISVRFGKLLRGGTLHVGFHDFSESSASLSSEISIESEYMGAFMFPELLLLASAKKQTVYQLQYIIPLQDIVAIHEFQEDREFTSEAQKSKFKHGWRILWEVCVSTSGKDSTVFKSESSSSTNVPSAFGIAHSIFVRGVDFGSKDAKDRIEWLKAFHAILPESRVHNSIIQIDDDKVSSPVSPDELDGRKRLTTVTMLRTPHNFATDQPSPVSPRAEDDTIQHTATDLKFSEVISSEPIPKDIARITTILGRTPKILVNIGTVPNNTLMGLFQRANQRVSAEGEASPTEVSGLSHKKSQKKKPKGSISSSNTDLADRNDPGLNTSRHAKSSFSDISSAVKRMVKSKGSATVEDLKGTISRTSSNTSLASEAGQSTEKKNWGNVLKAKFGSKTKLNKQNSNQTAGIDSAKDNDEAGRDPGRLSLMSTLSRKSSKKNSRYSEHDKYNEEAMKKILVSLDDPDVTNRRKSTESKELDHTENSIQLNIIEDLKRSIYQGKAFSGSESSVEDFSNEAIQSTILDLPTRKGPIENKEPQIQQHSLDLVKLESNSTESVRSDMRNHHSERNPDCRTSSPMSDKTTFSETCFNNPLSPIIGSPASPLMMVPTPPKDGGISLTRRHGIRVRTRSSTAESNFSENTGLSSPIISPKNDQTGPHPASPKAPNDSIVPSPPRASTPNGGTGSLRAKISAKRTSMDNSVQRTLTTSSCDQKIRSHTVDENS